MRLREEIGRLVLKLLFHPRYTFTFEYTDFDRKTNDAFFLLGNHPSANDPLFVGMNIKKYPYPIANALLYTNPIMRFALNSVIRSIPKRKGQSDTQTIRSILESFKKNRGVMLFPEGNASYYGAETPTEYLSTAKLIKKLGKDVVLAKINGGFLAHPRWGTRVKKGHYHIHYYTLFKQDQLKTMTVDQLKDTLEKAMKFNDYDWNRKMRIKYKTKKRAEGLEYYIYFCPKCQKIQTISTHGNDVYCSHCGTIATFDMYGFIEGLPFDNLVEWGKLQKEVLPSIAHDVYLSEGMMYEINFKKNKRIPLGFMRIKLENNVLTFEKNQNKFVFNIDDVQGLAISQKRFLSFDYIKQTYLVAFKDPMLFLDVIHTLKGDQ